MAPKEAHEDAHGAALIYSLFRKYATRVNPNDKHSVLGISYQRMKELMQDMGLLEGVPPGLADAYVREHMQRADQEGMGVIGSQDFLVWLLTEVAALLPLRDAFCRVMGQRPLYNQFHAVLLGEVGFTDGARRPATGLQSTQFIRLAEEYRLCDSTETVRHAFKAARAAVGGFRSGSGSNTGAPMAEPSGGGRLQFAAFVRALAVLAAHKTSSLESLVYKVVARGAAAADPSDGTPPSDADADADGAAAAAAAKPAPPPLTTLGLCSQLEGACRPEVYRCDSCGQEHTRWRLDNWLRLEELLLSVGVPQPVRRFMPALPLVNARNLRAVFHRYNAMYNRGKMPPSTYRLPTQQQSAAAAAAAEEEDGGADGGCGGGGCCCQPAAYGACCCLFRCLSLMEMGSWLRLCGDSDTLKELMGAPGSGLTPGSLESAFVAASSIGGVYFPDDCTGIHDVPVSDEEGGASRLGLQRNRLGAVVGSDTLAAAASAHPPSRSSAAYQVSTPAAGGPNKASSPTGAPRLHEVIGPKSAAAWLAAARSMPYGSDGDGGGGGGGSSGSGGRGRGKQHRSSRLALTFPQFLEALRLVAEEAGGHPTRTAGAERVLLRVVHDLVALGCPRPDPTTVAGTSQIRRRQRQASAAVTAAAAGETLSAYRSLRSVASATSATTSTKYTYDDFTPPESNLYTSASSSRIGGSQPAGRLGGPAAASVTSATTSTKYTYDDFTPPESNLYTSASSSRIGVPQTAPGHRTSGTGAGGTAAAATAKSAARPQSAVSAASFASATSATTSTKYTYNDFTPPESNLYTSASSSRIGGSQPAGRLGGPAASVTSATTSTKYTYDDFTPPESNLYTSASSSRIGSRPASAKASKQPGAAGTTGTTAHGGARGSASAAAAGSSHLQPKRGGVSTGSHHLAQTTSVPLPPPPSAWIRTMPPPPTARMQPTGPPAAPPAPAPTAVQPPLPSRSRPSSAPRMRPPSAGTAGDGGETAAAVTAAEDGPDEESHRERPARPASASRGRPTAPFGGAVTGGSGAGGGGWITHFGNSAVFGVTGGGRPRSRPSSAPRVRPASARAGGSGGGGGGGGVGSPTGRRGSPDQGSPVGPAKPPTPWKTAWESPGATDTAPPAAAKRSGPRPASAPRIRGGGGAASGAAAAVGTGLVGTSSGMGAAPKGIGRDGQGIGFVRPMSPSEDPRGPSRPAASQPPPQPQPHATPARQRPSAPPKPSPSSASAGASKPPRDTAAAAAAVAARSAAGGRAGAAGPVGVGFVSPILPEPYIPGSSGKAGKPPAAPAAAPAAAWMEPSAHALPYKSPGEYAAANVAAASGTVVHTSSGEGSTGSSKSILRGGSGLRNTMLLLATDAASVSGGSSSGAVPRVAPGADPEGTHRSDQGSPAGGLPPPPPPPPLPPRGVTSQSSSREASMSGRWVSGAAGTAAGAGVGAGTTLAARGSGAGVGVDSASGGSRRASGDSSHLSQSGAVGLAFATVGSPGSSAGHAAHPAHYHGGGTSTDPWFSPSPDTRAGASGVSGGSARWRTGGSGSGVSPAGTTERSPPPPPSRPPQYATLPDEVREASPLELVVLPLHPEEHMPTRLVSSGRGSSASGGAGPGAGGGASGGLAGGAAAPAGMGRGGGVREADAAREESEEDERAAGRWAGGGTGAPGAVRFGLLPGDLDDEEEEQQGPTGIDPAAPSPRTVLAAAAAAGASSGAAAARPGARERAPAEGTVNGLPQYFFR